MNALFENLKNNSVLNTEKNGNIRLKDCNLYKNINTKENNPQLNILNNERINLLAQALQELNIQYLKERQSIFINIGNNINSIKKNEKNECKNPVNPESKDNYAKNTINSNSLSEVKKFKTELCHSWELTGTCKYGLNVIKYLYNIYFNYFYYSVYLLMVLMI